MAEETIKYVTITEFAKLKKVSRTTVHKHIKDGKIITEKTGMPLIDWGKYDKYTFAEPKWNKESQRKKIMEEEQAKTAL